MNKLTIELTINNKKRKVETTTSTRFHSNNKGMPF